MKSETKQCQNCKRDFTIEPADFAFYEKIKVPAPTWCPECRMVRRMVTYNRRVLYKAKCALCEKEIFSILFSDKSPKIFCNKCWWSDKWDAVEYARNYDFSRPFLQQLKELLLKVPQMAMYVDHPTMVNSEHSNASGHLKNCYLVFHADFVEDSSYCDTISSSKDCFDSTMISESQLCYGSVNIQKCYRVFFSVDCESSFNIYFSKNLVGCSDCYGCINLRNKQYYIFNQPYKKEEYFKKLEKFNIGSYSSILDIEREAQDSWLKSPSKYIHGRHNVNVSGDYIEFSKNTFHSFFAALAEDSKYCSIVYLKPTKDSYDYTSWGNNASQIYECQGVGENVSRIRFSHSCWPNCIELEYTIFCINSQNLFGSIGLRNKQYCILNKQYTKEEYEALVPKIIEHTNAMPYIDQKGRIYKYGEFFPPELSPFAYNETIAQEYFPLTKEEALQQGYRWKDPEEKEYTPTMNWRDLPDHINDVSDSILNETILCSAWDEDAKKAQEHNCTKVFRVIPQELEFYRKMNLPLPRLCPNSRHFHRIQQRNPLRLWHRRCTCAGVKSENEVYQNTASHFHGSNHCPNEFETSYAPERPEIVYCEKCYQGEVV